MIPEQHDNPTAKRAAAALIVTAALLFGCGTAQKPAGLTHPSAAAPEMEGRNATPGDRDAAAAVPGSAMPSDEPPSPLGRDWIFTQVEGFTGTLPGPPPVAGFIMTREGQRLTGSTGCNRMGSGYELNAYDGALRFTKLTNTRMMCDRIAADTEQAVLDAMLATDAFRIVDGKLELLSKGRMVARLSAP